jgi:next to BRCA1 gene 1 protein
MMQKEEAPSKFCSSCMKAFEGDFYKCAECPFYTMVRRFSTLIIGPCLIITFKCSQCQALDSPAKIHRFLYSDAHVMNKVEDGAIMSSAATPTPRSVPIMEASAPEVPEPVVHRGIICDVCNETITGVRHKCLDCPGMATHCIENLCLTDPII